MANATSWGRAETGLGFWASFYPVPVNEISTLDLSPYLEGDKGLWIRISTKI